LCIGEFDVTAPGGEGCLRDGDQVADLVVREAEAAEGRAQFGALPAVEVVPFGCALDEVVGISGLMTTTYRCGVTGSGRSTLDAVAFPAGRSAAIGL